MKNIDYRLIRSAQVGLFLCVFAAFLVFGFDAEAQQRHSAGNRNQAANAAVSPTILPSPQLPAARANAANARTNFDPTGGVFATLFAFAFLFLTFAVPTGLAFSIRHLIRTRRKKRDDDEQNDRDAVRQDFKRQYNADADFETGVYTGGLVPGANRRTQTFCLVTPAEFVFISYEARAQIGAIARKRVGQVQIESQSFVTNRASPAAVVLLGAPGLLVRKNETHESYAINLHYGDERGLAQNARFEFDGYNAFARASEAGNRFKAHILPPP